MIPARPAPILFGLILSGLMSCIVSGIATVPALGLGPGVAGGSMGAWATGRAVAFPAVPLVAPPARRIVARLTARA